MWEIYGTLWKYPTNLCIHGRILDSHLQLWIFQKPCLVTILGISIVDFNVPWSPTYHFLVDIFYFVSGMADFKCARHELKSKVPIYQSYHISFSLLLRRAHPLNLWQTRGSSGGKDDDEAEAAGSKGFSLTASFTASSMTVSASSFEAAGHFWLRVP